MPVHGIFQSDQTGGLTEAMALARLNYCHAFLIYLSHTYHFFLVTWREFDKEIDAAHAYVGTVNIFLSFRMTAGAVCL